MKCSNQSCGKELDVGSQFCTYCGEKQVAPTTAHATLIAETSAPSAKPTAPNLIMRASDKIWDFTESEGEVKPSERRPTIVLDEQSTHLAHTDQQLTMVTLHERVESAIQHYDVPVDVVLLRAQWQNDPKESRERIVASLKNHVFNDIKVIFGLDYMGKWANIHITIGMEPTPIEESESFTMPEWIWYLFMASGGALLLGFFTGQHAISLAAVAAAGFGVWSYSKAKKAHADQQVSERNQTEARRARERMSRTYKIDDIRLFCTAMHAVYQAVVDDIVQKGGKVVRVAGGHGGYLSDSEDFGHKPVLRTSNAGDSEV